MSTPPHVIDEQSEVQGDQIMCPRLKSFNFWTSGLQNEKRINFCALSHSICSTFYGSDRKLNQERSVITDLEAGLSGPWTVTGYFTRVVAVLRSNCPGFLGSRSSIVITRATLLLPSAVVSVHLFQT